jgi:hypothetical protein
MLGSIDKTEESPEDESKREAWVPTKLNWTVFVSLPRPSFTTRTSSLTLSSTGSGIVTSVFRANSKA